MPKSVTEYKLLISCPGDVQEEVEIINGVVKDFNDHFTDHLGISLRAVHWSKNSYPQSGGKPQQLLNQQFVRDCDAAIAVMWTRFGTPTDEYGSGTEEEIEIMLKQGKQVFMYFSDCPIAPSQATSDGYKQICNFRDTYKDRGVYWVYSSKDEFRELLFAHLTQHFMIRHDETVQINQLPALSISDIAGKTKPSYNTARPCSLSHLFQQINDIESEIIANIQKVAQMTLSGNAGMTSNDDRLSNMLSSLKLGTPISISRDDKEIVAKFAQEHCGLSVSEEFFSLGNLSSYPTGISINGTHYSLDGSEAEKKKYNLIQKCISSIEVVTHLTEVANLYGNLTYFELALTRVCFQKHIKRIIMQGEYEYNRDEQKRGTWKRAYQNEWQYV